MYTDVCIKTENDSFIANINIVTREAGASTVDRLDAPLVLLGRPRVLRAVICYLFVHAICLNAICSCILSVRYLLFVRLLLFLFVFVFVIYLLLLFCYWLIYVKLCWFSRSSTLCTLKHNIFCLSRPPRAASRPPGGRGFQCQRRNGINYTIRII